MDSLTELGFEPSQLRALTEHSPDVIMVLDLACLIRFINWTAPGLTVEGVLGTAVFEYVPADQHAEMRACFDHVARTATPGSYRNVFAVPGDLPTQWESRVAPIVRDGVVGGFTVFSRDVTQQARRSRELDEFFELSLDFMCLADFEGHFIRVNETFTRVLGFDEQELLTAPFLDLLHPDDVEGTVAALRRLAQGLTVVDFENRYRTRDGSYRRLSWRARADPGMRLSFGVARDVTDQRALEAQLLEAQKMDAVGQLAGGIAHDFNNLMQVVLGNTELSRRVLPADPAEALACLDEIEQAGLRAVALTGRLLAFSRREPLAKRPVDLNTLCLSLIDMLRRLIPEHVAIEFVPADGLPHIEGDAHQLEQVVMNLAVNARDAMPNGGRLTIRTEGVPVNDPTPPGLARGPHVRLSVEDTGVGMSADVVDHIFEPFFTTKDPGKGTGLGLSIAYAIVRQHGGVIQAASQPGHGTCFTIHLRASNGCDDGPAKQDPVAAQSGSGVILVVEDDDLVRRSVVRTLERAGYTVLQAASGREAVETVSGFHVDLALLDVVMPGLSGPDTYAELVRHQPGLPVVFTTGYASGSPAPSRMPSGHALLSKPYQQHDLLGRIRGALDRR